MIPDNKTREALKALNSSLQGSLLDADMQIKLAEQIQTQKKWDAEFEKKQREKQKIPGKHDPLLVYKGTMQELLEPLKESMEESLNETRRIIEKIERREVLDRYHANIEQMLEYEKDMLDFNMYLADQAAKDQDEERMLRIQAEISKTKENIAFYEKQIAEGEG